ncbi:hypothetical protein U9M48_031300 [Paspalum notatum var. saurae]|uniref:Uncharacterized protein n=1 Tax=Paspalum notatum var. saurae TaxID=547442 RepID=A0AAQ3U2Y8_PASNO
MAGEKGGPKKRGDFEVFATTPVSKTKNDAQGDQGPTVQVMFPVLQMIQHEQELEPVGHYFLLVLNPHNKQFEVLDSMRTLADETLRIYTCKTNSENACMDGGGGGSFRPKLAFSVNFV